MFFNDQDLQKRGGDGEYKELPVKREVSRFMSASSVQLSTDPTADYDAQ